MICVISTSFTTTITSTTLLLCCFLVPTKLSLVLFTLWECYVYPDDDQSILYIKALMSMSGYKQNGGAASSASCNITTRLGCDIRSCTSPFSKSTRPINSKEVGLAVLVTQQHDHGTNKNKTNWIVTARMPNGI